MSSNRFRHYGLPVGKLPTGPSNSITDVPGVTVGHVTLHSNDQDKCIRTGVTAILPHQGNLFRQKVAAAAHVINGFGKTTGLVQVHELGCIESPIMLTNTFAVPAVTEGTLQYMMELDAGIGDWDGSINVVTGECNDKVLNDMRGLHVRPEHAVEAIHKALQGEVVEEGSVGAGTGMVCYGWKGGIGTSSRMVEVGDQPYHLGVLVLSNFGAGEDLTILGRPVGKFLKKREEEGHSQDGSIIIVVGTDLPMDSRQLQRIAKRAVFGLGRTGSVANHGSGDIVIAFSNGNRIPHTPESSFITMQAVREDGPVISACFRAVAEATEEAIYNSLFTAQKTIGRNGTLIPALPVNEVVAMLRK
ncbi:DmpA family aminopeptidase [Paenibacillus cremeus]|uniref:P1 family peptidase n=1 Tax=Paenibacillus cremeus TaxID=2163881 RepID=A0A559K9S0_9BACL|nr:P1 family peptidase [Paenibacillus cremeus]TVY08866.1 P1 family peptidase [Paenibacillus cremeus]